MVTPTTARSVALIPLIPLLRIEPPHAEEEADEHSAAEHGQKEDRQRLLS